MGWSTFTCTCQGLICLGFVWAMKNAVVLICRQPVIVAKCTVTLFIIVTAFLAPSLRSTVQGPRSTVHRDEPRPFACLSAYVAGRVGTRLGEESDGSTPAAWPLWGFGTEHAVQSLSFAPHRFDSAASPLFKFCSLIGAIALLCGMQAAVWSSFLGPSNTVTICANQGCNRGEKITSNTHCLCLQKRQPKKRAKLLPGRRKLEVY